MDPSSSLAKDPTAHNEDSGGNVHQPTAKAGPAASGQLAAFLTGRGNGLSAADWGEGPLMRENLSRSSSAPPVHLLQGPLMGSSLASKQTMDDDQQQDYYTADPEDPRRDPEYAAYYHLHSRLDPRLPPPLYAPGQSWQVWAPPGLARSSGAAPPPGLLASPQQGSPQQAQQQLQERLAPRRPASRGAMERPRGFSLEEHSEEFEPSQQQQQQDTSALAALHAWESAPNAGLELPRRSTPELHSGTAFHQQSPLRRPLVDLLQQDFPARAPSPVLFQNAAGASSGQHNANDDLEADWARQAELFRSGQQGTKDDSSASAMRGGLLDQPIPRAFSTPPTRTHLPNQQQHPLHNNNNTANRSVLHQQQQMQHQNQMQMQEDEDLMLGLRHLHLEPSGGQNFSRGPTVSAGGMPPGMKAFVPGRTTSGGGFLGHQQSRDPPPSSMGGFGAQFTPGRLSQKELDMYAAYEFQQLGHPNTRPAGQQLAAAQLIRNDPIFDRPMSAQARLSNTTSPASYAASAYERGGNSGRYGYSDYDGQSQQQDHLIRPGFRSNDNGKKGPSMRTSSPGRGIGSGTTSPQGVMRRDILATGYRGPSPGPGSDNGGTLRSPLLEEFRNNKNRKYELRDIYGSVVEFSGDQHGSRFIQQKLETANSEEKQVIFDEILPNCLQLMTDVFGNYVVQKFFEHGNQIQKQVLASQMEGHVLSLSLQMYGCRVVQKALEHVLMDQQTSIIMELEGNILKCVKDQNGNHVIQKAIERIPVERIGFIIGAFQGQIFALATHPYGCRVIQRIFEHCPDFVTEPLLDELHRFSVNLIQDQYGNYVIQHVLERGKPKDRALIVGKVFGQVLTMAKHKFASNVVEKCVAHGTKEDRQKLIEEVIQMRSDGIIPLVVMMKDQFANYVIQKMLDVVDPQQKQVLIEKIRPHLSSLKKFTYGKHLITKVEKMMHQMGMLS